MTATKSKRGRKPAAESKSGKIREMLKAGEKPMAIARQLKCTPGLVYNVRSRMSGLPSRKAKVVKMTKGSAAAQVEGLGAILAAVKSSERERESMRRSLERIQAILNEALN